MKIGTADLYELDAVDRNYARRAYRILRIRVPYAAPGSPDLDGYRHSGHSYGMSREGAKQHIMGLLSEINWHIYLGSK